MKKIKITLLAILMFLNIACSFSQNDTTFNPTSEIVNVGIAIANQSGFQIIKGIDNGVSGTLITLIIVGVFRFVEKRKLKRRYDKTGN